MPGMSKEPSASAQDRESFALWCERQGGVRKAAKKLGISKTLLGYLLRGERTLTNRVADKIRGAGFEGALS